MVTASATTLAAGGVPAVAAVTSIVKLPGEAKFGLLELGGGDEIRDAAAPLRASLRSS